MDRFEPRRLLVTGGAGFIGANFVHYWFEHNTDCRMVVLDALTYAGNPANLGTFEGDPRFRLVQGDIREESLVEDLLASEGIDTIVHFAAESHVDRSIHGPDVFVETNVVGTHALLKVAKRLWIDRTDRGRADRRFHHVSTDEVYGSLGPAEPLFRESTPYAPNSPYAASKAGSDHLARAYHRTYGLPVVSTNCSNNYGPFQFPEKLIPLVIVNVLHGKAIPIYGDGLNVRDWLYVRDHCAGIEAALRKGRVGETYNLGGRCERTNLELVRSLCGAIDEAFHGDPALARRFPDAPCVSSEPAETLITFVKDRAGHDQRYAIDPSKAEQELGYRIRESLRTGLARTVSWYLEHEDWWTSVMDGSYREWIDMNYAPSAPKDTKRTGKALDALP